VAWTVPMTFADGTALTAAQMNTYLRDNLNETMTAKATTAGGLFFSTDVNEWAERIPAYMRRNTTFSTTSATYVNAADLGPRVTVTTGTDALVLFAAHITNSSANSATYCSYNVSGASSIASAEAQSIRMDGLLAGTGDNSLGAAMFDIRNDLTPGENTFQLTYRVDAGTGSFAYRVLAVVPLA
jgi:hypothetical protein